MHIYVLHPHINFEVLRPYHSEDMAHFLCVCVSRPVTLTFDLLTSKLVHNVARVIGYPPANFGDTTTWHFRFLGHWANTPHTDHVTLRP